jgi:carboxymethylenebutenolidase
MKRKKASEFPQEVLDLFDRYVHGGIDRRGFLDGVQRFAVGGLTAAMILESLQPNFAWAQQVPRDDKRLSAEWVEVPSPLGSGTIKGYLVRPAKGRKKLGAVLVIHENRGLNPYIEDVARRLALDGFLVLAPDALTTVGGYPGDEDKGRALFAGLDKGKLSQDFLAAGRWLKGHERSNGKLGAVGFCYGGGIVNMLAAHLGKDLSAGVPFYGSPPGADDSIKIVSPLLIHNASLDTRILSGYPAYEAILKKNNVPFESFIYEGANHGFHNDTTPRYDEAAAKLAWKRTIAFFKNHLK